MHTVLVIYSFAIFGISISSCRERFRRQLWGPSPGSDPFWGGHSPEYHENDGFFDSPKESDESWNRPQAFDSSFPSPQNNFQGEWDNNKVNNFGNGFDNFNNGFDSFKNGFDSFNNGNRQNNQNSRKNNQNDRRKNQNNNQNQKKRQNQNQTQNQNQNKKQNQNQNKNRRTTTTTTVRTTGPLTTTPSTIHYAPQGCECPMTQQFNPVCGTDGRTYRNEGLLNCYVRCGANISRKRLGTC